MRIADITSAVFDGIAGLVTKTTPARMFRRAGRYRRAAQRKARKADRATNRRRKRRLEVEAADLRLRYAETMIVAYHLNGKTPPSTIVEERDELLAAWAVAKGEE